MSVIYSYVNGSFQESSGDLIDLLNPATEEVAGQASLGGVDLVQALHYARDTGIPALQAMTFAERGELLAKMAATIHEHRDVLIEASIANNGATRGGSKFDVDGASGTLAAYAEVAKELGEGSIRSDGEAVGIGRGARLHGAHGFVSRQGVAVFINAFNFPAWGFAEKAATALLAGMPVISKPATLTSLTAGRLAEILVAAEILPPGLFSHVLGPVTDLLGNLGPQDVVAFTGSGGTAAKIRSMESLIRNSVTVNVEADSLNAAVLASGTETDSAAYQLFIRDAIREITEKSGQKCTATRRLIVAEDMVDQVVEDLSDRLSRIKIGNPASSGVELGPLATRDQFEDVLAGIQRLGEKTQRVFGESRPGNLIDVPEGKGFFVGPTLFCARGDEAVAEVHRAEVFGPVATLLPFEGAAKDAIDLVARGGGCLVSEVYSDDRRFAVEVARGIAPFCGRVVVVDSKCEGYSLPPGMVLPQLNHGGPGRAGGGSELGGARGLDHYMHRAAFQGSRGMVEKILRG